MGSKKVHNVFNIETKVRILEKLDNGEKANLFYFDFVTWGTSFGNIKNHFFHTRQCYARPITKKKKKKIVN